MEKQREQATVKEIIEVISDIILKSSISKTNNKDVGKDVKISTTNNNSIVI